MVMEVFCGVAIVQVFNLMGNRKGMRSYFNLVDFWDAAALYIGFNCVNYSQRDTALPFCGGEKRFRHT